MGTSERAAQGSHAVIALELLRRIPRVGHTTAQRLRDELAAAGIPRDERSIQRQLKRLTEQFDIECDDRSKPHGYRWKSHAPALSVPRLTSQESLLLTLAEQHLNHLLPPTLTKSMAGFFAQARSNVDPRAPHEAPYAHELDRQWLHKVRVVSETQPLLPPPLDPQVFEAVSHALYLNHWLDIEYCNAAKTTVRARVMPLGLAQQGPRLYLVVRFEGYDNERSLALHRITHAKVVDLDFSPPQEFDLQRYDDDGRFGFGDGKRIKLKFRIEKGAGQHLLETPLSEDQTCVVGKTHLTISATVVDSGIWGRHQPSPNDRAKTTWTPDVKTHTGEPTAMTDTIQESVQEESPSPPDPLEQRLTQFLDSWRAAQSNRSDDAPPLEQRLNEFIEQWKATYTTPAASDDISVAPVDWSLRLEALESFLHSFEPVRADIARRRKMGRNINIWADAGIGREEVRNSKILAWLLDFHGSHGQQAGILKSIIQHIGHLDQIHPSLFDDAYSTSVEACPLEDRTNRVDIAISSNKALLYFEIKIDARESNGQLTRYLSIANEAAGVNRTWHVVYLTPQKTSDASVIGHPRFTHIRWLDVAAAITGYSSKLDDGSFAQRILTQYAEHIRLF